MKKEKPERYRIVSSRFIDSDENLFTYEITFNKSLVHTGKFSGIEKGLNKYDKTEPFVTAFGHIKGFFSSLWYGLSVLFKK